MEDDASYECSCCEDGDFGRDQTRNIFSKKSSARVTSLKDADINLFEKGNTNLCELQPKHLDTVAKSLW